MDRRDVSGAFFYADHGEIIGKAIRGPEQGTKGCFKRPTTVLNSKCGLREHAAKIFLLR